MLFDHSQEPEDQSILVIGASGFDIVGRLQQPIATGSSTPATIRPSYGGTARNFSENVARLGLDVTLLSIIGTQPIDKQMLKYTTMSGVNTEHVIRSKKATTGAYIAVVDEKGALQFALDDMKAISMITPEYLQSKADLFDRASMLFLDLNIHPDTLETIFALAEKANLPVIADPTSSKLAPRLLPYLSQTAMVTPNLSEAAILSGVDVRDSRETDLLLKAAKKLVYQGIDLVIITLAEFGVVYATSETSGHIPAIRTRIVDPTGGGDALTAAVVFAICNQIPVDEAIRLGISAASLTLRHTGAVRPDLSLELLYSQLL